MKRHRVTVELQLDLPNGMSIENAIPKLKIASTSITIGEFKVLSDEPLPETLLPFEQYDNEKIAIRNAILEVFKKQGLEMLCVKIASDTGTWSERMTHLATRPMIMSIWAKATHDLRHKGTISFRISDGVIKDRAGQAHVCSLADPDFAGLVTVVKNHLYPQKKKVQSPQEFHHRGYGPVADPNCYKCAIMSYPCGDHK